MKKVCMILISVMLAVSLACPVYASAELEVVADAVTVPATDIMLEFFPALFDGIVSLFEVTPMLYLFSIFILAFVVLFFRTITRL